MEQKNLKVIMQLKNSLSEVERKEALEYILKWQEKFEIEKIDEDTSKIKDAENKILELKSDKKYQTESEQNATEASITKLKNLISSTRNLGEDRVKKVKELKDKITKLELKKRDYGV